MENCEWFFFKLLAKKTVGLLLMDTYVGRWAELAVRKHNGYAVRNGY